MSAPIFSLLEKIDAMLPFFRDHMDENPDAEEFLYRLEASRETFVRVGEQFELKSLPTEKAELRSFIAKNKGVTMGDIEGLNAVRESVAWVLAAHDIYKKLKDAIAEEGSLVH